MLLCRGDNMRNNTEVLKISERKALELLEKLEKGGILLADTQPAFSLKVKAIGH